MVSRRKVPCSLSLALGIAAIGLAATILPAFSFPLPGIWAVIVVVPSTLAVGLGLPIRVVVIAVKLIPVWPLPLFCLLPVIPGLNSLRVDQTSNTHLLGLPIAANLSIPSGTSPPIDCSTGDVTHLFLWISLLWEEE